MQLLTCGVDPAGAWGGCAQDPWLPAQGMTHLALRVMVRSVYTALWAAVLAQQDIALGAGATH